MATYSLSQLASDFSALEKGATADFYVIDQRGVIAATHALNASEPKRFSVSDVAMRALAVRKAAVNFRLTARTLF